MSGLRGMQRIGKDRQVLSRVAHAAVVRQRGDCIGGVPPAGRAVEAVLRRSTTVAAHPLLSERGRGQALLDSRAAANSGPDHAGTRCDDDSQGDQKIAALGSVSSLLLARNHASRQVLVGSDNVRQRVGSGVRMLSATWVACALFGRSGLTRTQWPVGPANSMTLAVV